MTTLSGEIIRWAKFWVSKRKIRHFPPDKVSPDKVLNNNIENFLQYIMKQDSLKELQNSGSNYAYHAYFSILILNFLHLSATFGTSEKFSYCAVSVSQS